MRFHRRSLLALPLALSLGAAGNVGTAAAAKARPDGYTLMITADSAMVMNPSLYKSTGFDPIKGFGATPWYGMFAPAGTPKAIVAQLNAAIAKAPESKDVQERLAVVGCEPYRSTPEQFAALVRDDLPRWAKIVKDSGTTID